MAIYKKGTCHSSIIVSSSIYKCTSCDYTEMVDGDSDGNKICPECQAEMRMISSQAGTSTDE